VSKLTTFNRYALFLAVTALAVACTTKRDGFVYRTYHNTTAYFNGYFNANESVKKGVAKLKEAHEEDYDKILPIFIYGTEESAKGSYPEMEKAIEKCSKVINKHNMNPAQPKPSKRPKINKWIDDNYLKIGEAYFYKRNYLKAVELFQYVNRKYDDKSISLKANTWLARTFIAQKEYSEANQALNRVDIDEDMDPALKADYYLVYADNLIQQGKLEQAAEKMESALRHIEKKRDRARPTFILAQIYQELNKCSESQAFYKAVEKCRPPYELEFYSKINRATAFCRKEGNSGEIRKELFKMLKDEKNLTYQDQIYYALANLELKEQKRDLAIEYLEKSLEVNTDNKKQKMKSFLMLADLFFNERQYESAQAYYDSTFSNISEDHVRYKEIKARAESLTELIGYLNTIELQDSLIQLCSLSPEQLSKKIKETRKKLEKEMEEKRLADELAAQQAAESGQPGITDNFWVYNSTLRVKGKENFVDYWGDRPLKDNWRLSSRLASSFGDGEQETGEGGNTTTENVDQEKYKVPSEEELMASLPCDDPFKMEDASASVAEAYYNAGVIYKEKLDDDDNAINSWEQLITNLDESDFHPTSMYQLFRTWLGKEQTPGYSPSPFCSQCSSKFWGDMIKDRYPGSEWARLIDNPEYLDYKELKEAEERVVYEPIYRAYTERNYAYVIEQSSRIILEEPDNHLICKYRLLRAICTGYSDAPYSIKENYQRELNELVQKCPGSDEAKRAEELLAGLNGGKPDLTEEPKVDEGNGEGNEVKPEVESPFKIDEGPEQYVAVVLPVQGTNINTTKATVSDFNSQYYNSNGLKVTNNLIDKTSHIVLVKSFTKIADAQEYIGTLNSVDDAKLKELVDPKNKIFVISKSNYITLFKTKSLDLYLQFYEQNY
jgi:tetratricopeptide (TPR) repeat protein